MNRMQTWARAIVMALVTAGVVAAAAPDNDDKYGKGVLLTEATSIKSLCETPDKFIGKTIRVDGIVTAVCEEMGCWMAIGETEKSEKTVRMKVEHGAGIVFPISAKGKAASAEGVFEKIAGEVTKFQIQATGAIVRKP